MSRFLDYERRRRRAQVRIADVCAQAKHLRAGLRKAIRETLDGMPWASDYPVLVPVVAAFRAADAALAKTKERPQTMEQAHRVVAAAEQARKCWDLLLPALEKLKADLATRPDRALFDRVAAFHEIVVTVMKEPPGGAE